MNIGIVSAGLAGSGISYLVGKGAEYLGESKNPYFFLGSSFLISKINSVVSSAIPRGLGPSEDVISAYVIGGAVPFAFAAASDFIFGMETVLRLFLIEELVSRIGVFALSESFSQVASMIGFEEGEENRLVGSALGIALFGAKYIADAGGRWGVFAGLTLAAQGFSHAVFRTR